MARIVAVADAMDETLAVIDGGQLAAIPTETVYGLAADAANGHAIAAIFEAKGRPRFNPLICHVSGMEMALAHAVFDPQSMDLVEAFWPGPLTVVLPARPESAIHPLVSAGQKTLALRSPLGFASDLIATLGRPVAAPSANTSGKISATTAAQVEADLGASIELIVDGGPCSVGLESTIVKYEEGNLRLLRPGGIVVSEIEKVTGKKILHRSAGTLIEAPGMMVSHYAPSLPLRMDVSRVFPDDAVLAFGEVRAAGAANSRHLLNLSPSGDLREAAVNLFAFLDRLDRTDSAGIAVEPVPQSGLGEAINDRLRRAAAPRPNLRPAGPGTGST